MDRAIHNRADVSIGTHPEEERMQGGQIIEATDEFRVQLQMNYDSQIKGSKSNALIKDG